jgi:hypothetical protein
MTKEPERNNMPVRLTRDAIAAAKIAASFKGMTLSQYASTVLVEAANRDIDAWTRARGQVSAKATGRKGGSK